MVGLQNRNTQGNQQTYLQIHTKIVVELNTSCSTKPAYNSQLHNRSGFKTLEAETHFVLEYFQLVLALRQVFPSYKSYF